MIPKNTRYILVKRVLRKGTKTEPIIVRKKNQRFVFKVFGRGTGFTHQQAKDLSQQVIKYHETLKSTGLRVSKILTVLPIQETNEGRHTGKWLLASKDQFIGRNQDVLQSMASGSEKTVKKLFGQLLEQLNLVTSYKSSPNKPSKILIDSVPKNWVERNDGKIVYVDFFTPKFVDSRGKLSPFYKSLHTRSRSHLQFRYQNKGGIYSVLLTYIVSERPSLKNYFEKTLVNFLKKQGETDAAKMVENTINNNYRVSFINPKITNKIFAGGKID